jgi:glucosamine 6-phosphate synthetase-like amidotransferase/phosphosugar isomerase protein
MCAIFGIGFQNEHSMRNAMIVREIVEKMFLLSSGRGTDATGIAISSLTDIKVLKHKVPAKKFLKMPEFSDLCEENIHLTVNNPTLTRTMSIIGHCRMKTKGTPENNDNNHPIVANSVVGVHNGMITNDDSLFDFHIHKDVDSGFTRRAEVDSEIIFRLLDYFSVYRKRRISFAMRLCSTLLRGGFACAFVSSRKPFMLWMFRNYNPIDIVNFPEMGLTLFSSSKEFIEKATAGAGLGTGIEMPFDTHCGIGINLIKNTYHKFELDKPDDKGSKGSDSVIKGRWPISRIDTTGGLQHFCPPVDQSPFYPYGINV